MTSSTAVSTRTEGDVAVVTIDDGKANAISMEVADGLWSALDDVEASPAKAVVIAGREGKFSAGFHLPTMQSDQAMELMGKGGRLALRLFEFPKPVALAVTGHALAMGAVLLMTADHRVGADGDYKVGLNEVRIGLPLPPFASCLARHRLAPTHVTAATGLATIYRPADAVDVGFLDEVVPLEKVVDRAVELAAGWAEELDAAAFAATRGFFRGPITEELRGLIAGTDTRTASAAESGDAEGRP